MWDLKTGKETASIAGHTKPVNSVAFSADGKCLVTASDDMTVKVDFIYELFLASFVLFFLFFFIIYFLFIFFLFFLSFFISLLLLPHSNVQHSANINVS